MLVQQLALLTGGHFGRNDRTGTPGLLEPFPEFGPLGFPRCFIVCDSRLVPRCLSAWHARSPNRGMDESEKASHETDTRGDSSNGG
jgi:hypothetical protein